jgi:hypothetical protein
LQEGDGTNEDLLMKVSREVWWCALVCRLQLVQAVAEVELARTPKCPVSLKSKKLRKTC